MDNFLPQAQCFAQNWPILVTRVLADGLTFIAFFLIPVIWGKFATKLDKFGPGWWFFVWGGIVIFLCSLTHIFDILVLWWPLWYWTGALLQLVTGIAGINFVWFTRKMALNPPNAMS